MNNDVMNLPVEVLKVSNRTRKALKNNGYHTIQDLFNSTKRSLSFCMGVGEKIMTEVERALKMHDIEMKDR